MKLLTKRLTEIDERIEYLYSVSVDDFTASMCLSEIESLLTEKMSLEMLTFAHVDIKYAPYYGQVCKSELCIVTALVNFGHN